MASRDLSPTITGATPKRAAPPRPTMLEVHGALSGLLHAVSLELGDIWHDLKVVYRTGTYLAVEVECQKHRKQLVIDRLSRGAIHGPYDYRFSVSYSTSDDSEWQTVTAYVDLHHPRTSQASEGK